MEVAEVIEGDEELDDTGLECWYHNSACDFSQAHRRDLFVDRTSWVGWAA